MLRLLNLHVSRSRNCVESANVLLLTTDALLNGIRTMGMMESDSNGTSASRPDDAKKMDVFGERHSHFNSLRYGSATAALAASAIAAIGPLPTFAYDLGPSFSSTVYDLIGTTKFAVTRLVEGGYGAHGVARVVMLNSFLGECSQVSAAAPRFLPVNLPTIMAATSRTETFYHLKLTGKRGEAIAKLGLYHEYSSVRFLVEREEREVGEYFDDDGYIIRLEDGESEVVELVETVKAFFATRTETALKVIRNEKDMRWGKKAYLLIREVDPKRDESDNFVFTFFEGEKGALGGPVSKYKCVEGEGDEEGTFGYSVSNKMRALAI